MTFVGIVQHVIVDRSVIAREGAPGPGQLVGTRIDLESTDDKSKVALFVKHNAKYDFKAILKKGHVLLVKDALRKISNSIDIYVQLIFSINNFKVVGMVKDQMADF